MVGVEHEHGINNGSFLRIRSPMLSSIAAIIAVSAFIGGWLSSHYVFKAELASNTQTLIDLRASNQSLQERINVLGREDSDDRRTVGGRLTKLEVLLDRATQDLAEIRLNLLGKR